jgi:hypothetical protein
MISIPLCEAKDWAQSYFILGLEYNPKRKILFRIPGHGEGFLVQGKRTVV